VSARPGNPRRELVTAVLGAAVSGGLALSAAGQVWARVTATRPPPLPPVTDQVTGGQLAPLTTATGLLLLASAVALVAVRGAGRVAVGLLAALAGGVLVWQGLRPLTGGPAADVAALSSVGSSPGAAVTTSVHPAWPVLAALAGLVGLAAGLLTVLRGRRWPGMGRRYERPAGAAPAAGAPAAPGGATAATTPTTATTGIAATASAEDRAVAAWRALDRGEDPTDPTPGQA
jgi:uncharacterized membrane protein (TIGR02234 family)